MLDTSDGLIAWLDVKVTSCILFLGCDWWKRSSTLQGLVSFGNRRVSMNVLIEAEKLALENIRTRWISAHRLR